MNGTTVMERNGCTVLLGEPGAVLIRSEEDALELIGYCLGNDIDRIRLGAGNLSPDFFDLSTRLAGLVLQKFRTYRMKVAFCLPDETRGSGKFAAMVKEENRSADLRFFSGADEALEWLAS